MPSAPFEPDRAPLCVAGVCFVLAVVFISALAQGGNAAPTVRALALSSAASVVGLLMAVTALALRHYERTRASSALHEALLDSTFWSKE